MLKLQSAGTSEASNGETEVSVDEYTIALFAPVEGLVDAKGTHRIEPGVATLIISGRTVLGDYVLPVTNANEIVLEPGPNGWSMGDLAITYEDVQGDVWQLVVSTSGWTTF